MQYISSSMLTELIPQDIFGSQPDVSCKAIGSNDTAPSQLSYVQESGKEYGVNVSDIREVQAAKAWILKKGTRSMFPL